MTEKNIKSNKKISEFKDLNELKNKYDKKSQLPLIILDTNFLIIPKSIGVDVFSELDRLFGINNYDILIFDKTKNELDRLIETKKGKEKQQAVFAKSLFKFLEKSKGLKILHSEENNYIDDIIVRFIKSKSPESLKERQYFVATVDKNLQMRILSLNCSPKVKVITVRKKSFLMIVN